MVRRGRIQIKVCIFVLLFRIEKDCTSWAHDRIKNLLTSAGKDEDDGLSITKITNIEGDVSVNQRKGRVKQLFDLEISFEYIASDGVNGTGFISEFTADYQDPSDLNLKLTPHHAKKDSILKTVGRVVEEFKKELFEVHGKPLLLDAQKSENGRDDEGSNFGVVNAVDNKSFSTTSTTAATTTAVSNSASTTNSTAKSDVSSTISDEVTFPCPPEQLYLMLTDPARIRSWTRSPANLPQILLPQAPFSLFDGNISGKFLTLKSPSSIEMEWKLKSWTQSSLVTIEISASSEAQTNNSCLLKIKQVNVPSGEAEVIKSNWHNYYWIPIKRAFGVML